MEAKLALVQHPMYLLIHEDTQCAERTPPWGAPDIDTYIERIRRNLHTLRETPELKLGYEWSAVELEMLAERAPAVFQDMCDLVKRGSCTFYNGTYSQPHLQILSSEANYRQFEYGSRVYSELCGSSVQTYAHQETSVHEQLPQLLEAFGLRFVTMPEFVSTLIVQGEYELMYHRDYGPLLVEEHGIVDWRGIDGTEIPLYLQQKPGKPVGKWLEYQDMLGLQHNPAIYLEIPDLQELDEEWMAARKGAEFVILDKALEEELSRRRERPKVRFFTNWSYAEGIRAEELSRSNSRAEEAVLSAEALSAMASALIGRGPVSTDDIWQKILLTQHHDVYCFCAPELKDKSIAWLKEAEERAGSLARDTMAAMVEEMPAPEQDTLALAVFNTLPHSLQGVVTAAVPAGYGEVSDLEGNTVPTSRQLLPSGENVLSFIAQSPGLGYRLYRVNKLESGNVRKETDLSGPYSFENDHFGIIIEPDGSFSSLTIGVPKTDLLSDRANTLRAMDSSGIERGPKLPPEKLGQGLVTTNRDEWVSEGIGPELKWSSHTGATCRESPLGVEIHVSGSLAENAKAELTVSLYHQLPYIGVRWQFEFDACSIGTFYDDETKLRVQIPLAFDGRVYHDIPFGYMETKKDRPYFPTTWTDITDGERGIAYFHRGTPKHWISGNVLENLFAWGEFTDAIGNRLNNIVWGKSFDQRLNGSHTIEYALYPHEGGNKVSELADIFRSFTAPLTTYPVERGGSGNLRDSASLLEIENTDIIATSVQTKPSQKGIFCRLYSISAQETSINSRSDYLSESSLKSLKGDELNKLKPFQIASLQLYGEK